MVSRDRTRPFQQPDIAVIEDCAVGGAMVLVPRNAHIQANVHRGVSRPSPGRRHPPRLTRGLTRRTVVGSAFGPAYNRGLRMMFIPTLRLAAAVCSPGALRPRPPLFRRRPCPQRRIASSRALTRSTTPCT